MLTPSDTTRRTAVRVAGAGYVALFVLAIFANFVVKQGIVDPADAEATVAAIRAQEWLFRVGIAAFVLVFLIDVPVAWGLYVLFVPAGRARSLLAAWFRIVYTVFLGVGAVFMFLGLQIATGDFALGEQQAMLMLAAFDVAWYVGLIAFGVHLMLLGDIIIRSRIACAAPAISSLVSSRSAMPDRKATRLSSSKAPSKIAAKMSCAVSWSSGNKGSGSCWMRATIRRVPSPSSRPRA